MSVFFFLADGSNYIKFPTLGDLTDKKLRIHFDRLNLKSGALISQAENVEANQEFKLYRSGDALHLRWGGSNTALFDFIDIFGSTNPDSLEMDITFNVDSTFEILVDGVNQTPSANDYIRGSIRTDLMPLIVGGVNASSNPADRDASEIIGSESECGNLRIYIDDVLTRDIVMPGSGFAAFDLKNGQDGTLYSSNLENFSFPVLPKFSVSNQSELNSVLVANQSTGGIIELSPGNYGPMPITGAVQAFSKPYILKGVGNSPTDVNFNVDGNEGILVRESRYIGLTNLSTTAGMDGIQSLNSSKVVIKNVDVSNSGQGGIRIDKNSSFVDVVESYIHDTGSLNSQFGEGVYVGTGGSGDFPDTTSDIWIEDNEIARCGNAEAVDIKNECFRVTVRSNNIHDISPGIATETQINRAAISVSTRSSPTHDVSSARDIWIEENIIDNVSGGELQDSSVTNCGIMVGAVGCHVQNNRLSNIENRAVYLNSFGYMDLGISIYNNQVSNSADDEFISSGLEDNVTREFVLNPNRKQTWMNAYLALDSIVSGGSS